jgi:hypothetical protein
MILAASALTYMGTTLRDYYHTHFAPETIELHDFMLPFSDTYRGTLANSSHEDLYVSSMVLLHRYGSVNFEIGKTLKPHTFMLIDENPNFEISQGGKIMSLASDHQLNLDKIYQQADFVSVSAIKHLDKTDPQFPCLLVQFQSADTSALEHMSGFYAKGGMKLVTDRAVIRIAFLSPRSPEKQHVEIGLVAVFFTHSLTKRCQSSSLDSLQ